MAKPTMTRAVKVVMTGSATDPAAMQPHIRSKSRQEIIRNRYRNPEDPLKLVIVRDMWLTGFDAPCMHTLHVDKPMKGHGLMQAIARVNRVYPGKPAGLIVDYVGIATELKAALAHYSQSDRDQTELDPRKAVSAFLDALDVVRAQLFGFDYTPAITGSAKDRVKLLPPAIGFILGEGLKDDGASVKRYRDGVAALSKAFKLASGSDQASEHAVEAGFFTAIRKLGADRGKRGIAVAGFAIRQLVNSVVVSTEIIDVLESCGFDRPGISMLSEEFMAGLHRNLAAEALRKLLDDEVKARTCTNVAKQEEFSARLAQAIAHYHSRSIDALQVLQELIQIARALRAEPDDGLSPDERALSRRPCAESQRRRGDV